ncbi:hypothetical protein CRG98_019410 [Punica granatum]|uniref:Uncharacterized protein n=1 Tax=Punica granatum TaxID=22663 RepID=A0A2I0JVE1_PUNGR|nr:hypothetical protein CRG98_019410 [Punica granatum]
MALGRTYCGRVMASMFMAMAFSMPLLVHSSRAQCVGFVNGTPPLEEATAAHSASTQRGQSDSDSVELRFGEGVAEDSEREVPTGPDPLHHHYDPKDPSDIDSFSSQRPPTLSNLLPRGSSVAPWSDLDDSSLILPDLILMCLPRLAVLVGS